MIGMRLAWGGHFICKESIEGHLRLVYSLSDEPGSLAPLTELPSSVDFFEMELRAPLVTAISWKRLQ